MKKLFLTTTAIATIFALSGSVAFATDVNQAVTAAQTALNALTIIQNDDPTGSQAAVNAANLINLNNALNDVVQNAGGVQNATNTASSVFGQFQNFSQTATNVANSVSLADTAGIVHSYDNVASVSQGATGTQTAQNVASFGQGFGDLNPLGDPNVQQAVNAYNLVSVNDIAGTVTQSVSASSPQLATNNLAGGPNSYVKNAEQTATNVANSINANSVGQINQSEYGNQSAANTLTFGNGELLNATQAATNVANVASIVTLADMSSQYSSGVQQATNNVTYSGNLAGLGTSDVGQTAINAANLLTADHLPSIGGVTEVAQTAVGSQFAQNIITAPGTMSNITQAATNVANSLANPSSP